MELSSQMLVNCFASRKGNGKGWQSGKGERGDVGNLRDPCCHVWMQQWLRSEKRKGEERGRVGRVVSFWLCCAVQSSRGAPLTAQD